MHSRHEQYYREMIVAIEIHDIPINEFVLKLLFSMRPLIGIRILFLFGAIVVAVTGRVLSLQ